MRPGGQQYFTEALGRVTQIASDRASEGAVCAFMLSYFLQQDEVAEETVRAVAGCVLRVLSGGPPSIRVLVIDPDRSSRWLSVFQDALEKGAQRSDLYAGERFRIRCRFPSLYPGEADKRGRLIRSAWHLWKVTRRG